MNDDRKRKDWTATTGVSTSIIAFFTVIAVAVSSVQWIQLRISEQSNRDVFRAYLYVGSMVLNYHRFIGDDYYTVATVDVVNADQTPAYIQKFEYRLFFLRDGSKLTPIQSYAEEPLSEDRQSVTLVEAHGKHRIVEDIPDISSKSLELYDSDKMENFIITKIRYLDIYGKRHEIVQCSEQNAGLDKRGVDRDCTAIVTNRLFGT